MGTKNDWSDSGECSMPTDRQISNYSPPSQYDDEVVDYMVNNRWRLVSSKDDTWSLYTSPEIDSKRLDDFIMNGEIVEATELEDDWLKMEGRDGYAKRCAISSGFLPVDSCPFIGLWEYNSPLGGVSTFKLITEIDQPVWSSLEYKTTIRLSKITYSNTYSYTGTNDVAQVDIEYCFGELTCRITPQNGPLTTVEAHCIEFPSSSTYGEYFLDDYYPNSEYNDDNNKVTFNTNITNVESDIAVEAIKPGVCGLRNLGNTCFMNSVLQCLSVSESLKKTLIGRGDDDSVISTLYQVLNEISIGESGTCTPDRFKNSLSRTHSRFSGYEQHDSHELYTAILSALEQEGIKNSPFSIKVRTTLLCTVCQHQSIKDDPSLSIAVPCQTEFLSRPVITIKYLPSEYNMPAEVILVNGNSRTDVNSIVDLVMDSSLITLHDGFKLKVCGHRSGIPNWSNTTLCIAEISNIDNTIPILVRNRNTLSFEAAVSIEIPDSGKVIVSDIFNLVRDYYISWGAIDNQPDDSSSNNYNNNDDDVSPSTQPLMLTLDNLELLNHNLGTDAVNDNHHRSDIAPQGLIAVKIGDVVVHVSADDHSEVSLSKSTEIIVNTAWERPQQNHESNKTTCEWSTRQQLIKNRSLINCLEEYASTEQLGSNNMWNCPECKSQVRALRRTAITESPDFLTIQLGRFSYSGVSRYKIETPVLLQQKLNISPFVSSDNPNTSYSLVAVSNHRGSAYFGHCTADIRVGDEWWHLNDTSAVLSSFEEINSSHAYLLFYKLERPDDVPAS